MALYTAASTSERIAFHTINRATGHRVRRQFVDAETGEPVASDDQVKGYEVVQGEYVVLEPEEVAAVVPESDKTLSISGFVDNADIDDVYFDKPYYLAPSSKPAEETFALVREGLRAKKVAAVARAVLFRRVRTLLIRPHDAGLVATTLKFDYEVRPAKEAFESVPVLNIKGEMLQLAEHIVETKKGTFDPFAFEDRYEAALAELLEAKLAGRKIETPARPKREKVVDLMDALRRSAGATQAKEKATATKTSARSRPRRQGKAKAPAKRRKAG